MLSSLSFHSSTLIQGQSMAVPTASLTRIRLTFLLSERHQQSHLGASPQIADQFFVVVAQDFGECLPYRDNANESSMSPIAICQAVSRGAGGSPARKKSANALNRRGDMI
jgi:hypothetical protein